MADRALEAFEALFGPEFGHGKAFDRAPLLEALAALGAPQANLPPIIHVAGTNGKGSTIAFLRAIAGAAGLRVHAFTKPHLLALRERFVLAGKSASDAVLIDAAAHVARVAPALTQFDAQVVVALMLFDQTPADLVLLETGMGGRDDSTNAIPWPAAAVITPIGFDHQDVLGPSLAEITAHKAGILKRNTPAFIARQADDAMAVIEAEAARVGAPLYRCGVEWDAYVSHGRLVVQTESRALDLPLPALTGTHQIDNAGLACAVMLGPTAFSIGDDAFATGVTGAVWPGRLQPLTRGALSAPIRAIGGEVWVDGAHNAHAAAALARWAATMQSKRAAPLIVVFAARARKDWAMALKLLATAAECVIAVPMRDGVAPEDIARAAQNEGARTLVATDLKHAMQSAAQFPAPRVLICGSLVLAGEALAAENA